MSKKRKKKKPLYLRLRGPWRKSTEKVHDGGKVGKEVKRLQNELKEALHERD